VRSKMLRGASSGGRSCARDSECSSAASDREALSSSSVPADYTFGALSALTARLLRTLGIDRYAMYVQDYGAPIQWRPALGDPAAITAIIGQNGDGYDAGFVESFGRPCGTTTLSRPPRRRPRWAGPAATGSLGRGDEIFGPAGAEAFAEDLPDAEIHLLNGGHFLLELALDEVTELIRALP
jgi:hypothetical protein